MSCTLAANKRLLLISENGKLWTVVANVSTEREIDEVKKTVPAGMHMLEVDRLQLDTKRKGLNG